MIRHTLTGSVSTSSSSTKSCQLLSFASRTRSYTLRHVSSHSSLLFFYIEFTPSTAIKAKARQGVTINTYVYYLLK